MLFGYCRVSKKEQNPQIQIDALKKEGCDSIIQEKISGRSAVKPNFEKLKTQLRKGDTLIVYSLGRLGRTSKQLIDLIYDLRDSGVNFKSIKEDINTDSPMGRAFLEIVAVLKGMEVEILRERTKDGLASARSRGRKGGRPTDSYNRVKAAAVETLYKSGTAISLIEKELGISRATVYSYLRRNNISLKSQTNKG